LVLLHCHEIEKSANHHPVKTPDPMIIPDFDFKAILEGSQIRKNDRGNDKRKQAPGMP
jgi:hypothetical protein